MKNKVSVVVDDKLIIIDGEGYALEDFEIPAKVNELIGGEKAKVHALQWAITNEIGKGDIEFQDLDLSDNFIPVNKVFGEEEYSAYVQPFVDMWEAEKARLEKLASIPPTLDDMKQTKLQEWQIYDADYRKNATVEVCGKFFSISQDAKINLTAVTLMSVSTGADVTYFQKNGDYEEYNQAEFLLLSTAISKGIADAETNFYKVEASIKNANNLEELEAITWGEE